MKLVRIEHYDDMDDSVIFWLDVSDVSLSNQRRARRIAGSDYAPDCFGVCVTYDVETKEYFLIYDTAAGGRDYLYYIDMDGDKHWLPAKITRAFREEVFAACREIIDREGIAERTFEDEDGQ